MSDNLMSLVPFADNEILLSGDKYDYGLMENVGLQYILETDQTLQDALVREYGADRGEPAQPQLPALSSQLITKYKTAQGRALHLGCATGRTTFALASFFEQVMCDIVTCCSRWCTPSEVC